ncbi:MAG: cutinase family protein [Gordonia sp. (in: high G+C Gram-positive bacteria)]|uniref:cutinase family protein n=1 Tax=Gordonia sp. (in: high G+C Gram-positive bacteria) TaxID=84139 RepID=UPI0039E3A5B8
MHANEIPPSARVTLLVVGGTGEATVDDDPTEVTGMLSRVTEVLDERFVPRWVPYPAAYGPATALDGECYRSSLSRGVAALARAVDENVDEHPDRPVMLIGYSQGAAVIRGLLARPSARPYLKSIAAVGLVSDPHQPPGAVPGCDGWGVAGPGPDLPEGIPVFWVGAADDVICNASPDSLVRDVADLSETFSVGQMGAWLADVYDRVRSADLQNAAWSTGFSPSRWRRDVVRLGVAAREVRGYLPAVLELRHRRWRNPFGGRHVSYGSEPYRRAPLTAPDVTGCEVLAHWLQLQVTLGSGRPLAA